MPRYLIFLLALPLAAALMACDPEDPDSEPNPATQHYEPQIDPGGQVVH